MAFSLDFARRLFEEPDEEEVSRRKSQLTSMPLAQAQHLFESEEQEAPSALAKAGAAVASIGRGAATIASDIGRGALRAGTGVSIGVTSLMEALPGVDKVLDPEKLQYFQDVLADQANKKFGMSEATQEAIASGRRFTDPRAVLEQSSDVLSQLGLMIMSGGTGQLAAMAGEFGSAREAAEKRMLARGDDPDTAKHLATAEGGLVGATSYLMSKLTLGQFQPTAKMVGKVNEKLADRVLDMAKSGAKAWTAEAMEEMTTGAVQDVAHWAIENDTEAFEGFRSRRAAEAFFGGIAGAAAKGIDITTTSVRATQNKRYDAVVKQVESLEKTEEGREKLKAYAEKEAPSRADLTALGVKTHLNIEDRVKLAEAVDPAVVESFKHFVGKNVRTPEVVAVKEAETAEVPPPISAPETNDQIAEDAVKQVVYAPPKTRDVAPPFLKEEGGYLKIGKMLKNFSGTLSDVLGPPLAAKVKDLKRATIGLDPLGRKLKPFYKLRDQADFRIAARKLDLSQAVKRMNNAITKHMKVDLSQGMPADLGTALNSLLEGGFNTEKIPAPVVAEVTNLRHIIDANSRSLLNSGAITEQMQAFETQIDPDTGKPTKQTIWDVFAEGVQKIKDEMGIMFKHDPDAQAAVRESIVQTLEEQGVGDERQRQLAASVLLNEGVYLNRAFEAFTNKGWANQVPPEARENFYKLMAEEQPDMTMEDIEFATNKMLDAAAEHQNMDGLWQDGRFLKLSTNILKRRQDLPKEWLEILGEKKEVTENFVRTAYKQIEYVEKYRMAQQIREMGLGRFFWTAGQRPNNDVVPLNVTGGMSPLKDVYTTPEIREMIQAMDDKDWHQRLGLIGRAFLRAEGFVQRNQTIRNPTAHARQIFGNPMMMVRNGNLATLSNPKVLNSAFQTVRQVLSPELQADNIETLQKLTNLGIIDDTINIKSLQDVAKVDDVDTFMAELNLGKQSKWKFVRDLATKAPQRLYAIEDTFFKIASWHAEMDNYRGTTVDTSPEALEQFAADVVLRTMPSWSNLPPVVQSLRNVPFVGAFLTFPCSVWQTSFNTFRQTASDLQSPERQIQMVGAKRAVGMAAAGMLASTAIKAMSAMWDWTEEELEALRKIAPPWERYSSLAGLSKEGGQFSYVNLSYTDPHSAILEATRQFMEGVSEDGILAAFRQSATNAFMGIFRNKMTIDAVQNTMENDNGFGKKIWEPTDSWQTKAANISAHLATQLIEPAVSKRMRRYVGGLQGKHTQAGPLEPFDEAIQLWGWKRQTTLPRQQLFFGLKDYKATISSIHSFFTKLGRGGYISPGEIASTLNRAHDNRVNALAAIREKYDAAMVLQPELSGQLQSIGKSLEIAQGDYDKILTGDPGYEIPKNIDVIDVVLPTIADEKWIEELNTAKKDILNTLIRQSVSIDPRQMEERRRAKEQLDKRGLTTGEKLKMYLDSKTEESVRAKEKDILDTIATQRKKAGLAPWQPSQAVVRKAAEEFVQKRKDSGDWLKHSKGKVRDIVNLGFTREQLLQSGFTEEQLIEFLPSSGVPGGDQ